MILLSTILMFVAVAAFVWFLGPAWDTISSREVSDLVPRMRQLQMDTSRLHYYLRAWGISLASALFVMTAVLNMFPIAIAVGYLIFVTPRLVLKYMIRRRERLLRDQMVSASSGLSNAVRAGLSLAQGLEAVSEETPEPLVFEFRRIVFEWKCGRSLADSIHDIKQRLELDSFTLFSLAIGACLERGGKITEALERIASSLAENQRLERKLEADTASGRKIVIVLGIFPFLFLAAFMAMDPVMTGVLFTSFVGQLVLLAVIAVVYFAVRWCMRILTADI